MTHFKFLKHPFAIPVFLVCLWMFPTSGFSQAAKGAKTGKDFTTKLGTPYPVIDADNKIYFSQDGEILAVKYDKKKFNIQKFDTKTLRQTNTREINDIPDKSVIEGFLEVPQHVMMFYSLYDKKAAKEQLFVRPIDYKTGNFSSKGVALFTVDDKLSGTMSRTSKFGYGMEVTDKFDFHTSADSSMMMVQYRLKPEIKDDSKSHDIIGFAVFKYGTEIAPLWKKEVKMPYTEKKMDIMDFTVDSKGNAYVLARVFNDNSTKTQDRDRKSNYQFEIFKIDAGNQELKTIKVDLAGKSITGVVLWESSDGFLSLSGFYNYKNKGSERSSAEGLFHAKIKPDGTMGDFWNYDIPLEIINSYVSKREKEKNEKKEAKDEGGAGMDHLYLDLARRFSDGSYMLVGEQYRVVSHTHRSQNGATYTTYTYYYEDLLATKIGPDGKLVWMKKLPKEQVGSTAPGGMSYKFIHTPDYEYFLFLDNVKNLDLPLDKAPVAHKDGAGGYLTTYKLNGNTGDVARISIFNTKDVNGTDVFQFKPSRLIKVSDTEFVLEVYKKGKEDVLIKLTVASAAAN